LRRSQIKLYLSAANALIVLPLKTSTLGCSFAWQVLACVSPANAPKLNLENGLSESRRLLRKAVPFPNSSPAAPRIALTRGILRGGFGLGGTEERESREGDGDDWDGTFHD